MSWRRLARVAAIICGACLGFPAWSARASFYCGELLARSDYFWEQVRNQMALELANPRATFLRDQIDPARLKRDALLVLRPGSRIYRAWFNLQGQKRTVVFKDYNTRGMDLTQFDHPYYRAYVIQKTLGSLGIAPRAFGTYLHDGRIAVVMESLMPSISSFEYRIKPVDGRRFARLKRFERQLSEFKVILPRLAIEPGDPQCLVCPGGKLYLHDFDRYNVYEYIDQGFEEIDALLEPLAQQLGVSTP